MIWRIWFSKFSNAIPALTCASAIGNLWSIYSGVNILSPFACPTFYLASDGKKE